MGSERKKTGDKSDCWPCQPLNKTALIYLNLRELTILLLCITTILGKYVAFILHVHGNQRTRGRCETQFKVFPPFACVRDPWKNHIHLRSCRWHFGGERLFRHWVQSSVSSAVLRSNSAWLWVAVRENINRSPTIRTTHTREMLFCFFTSLTQYIYHTT